MKDVLEQIPMAVKAATVITAAVAGAIMWMLSTFETTTASELKWTQHNQALQCRTVYSLQKELRDTMEKRRNAHSPEDQAYYDQMIEYLKAEISRIDPNGDC